MELKEETLYTRGNLVNINIKCLALSLKVFKVRLENATWITPGEILSVIFKGS